MSDLSSRLLDGFDRMLIAELEVNARQSITDLARKLGASRATVRSKMERLLSDKIISVVPIAAPLAMGYKTRVMVGINTHPNQIDSVADELASHKRIHHVAIFTGRYDVMAWAILEKPEDLSDFVRIELANVKGITRAETMVNLKMAKVSYAFLADDYLRFRNEPPEVPLDELDLRIIRELRSDALQTQSDLSARLGISPSSVRRRLTRLLDENILRIIAIADPQVLGYRTRATVGINVQPSQVDAVADELATFRCVHHILINTGRFDLIVSADFRDPEDLSSFVREELGNIPGLTSHETMVCLKTTKDDFTFATQV